MARSEASNARASNGRHVSHRISACIDRVTERGNCGACCGTYLSADGMDAPAPRGLPTTCAFKSCRIDWAPSLVIAAGKSRTGTTYAAITSIQMKRWSAVEVISRTAPHEVVAST